MSSSGVRTAVGTVLVALAAAFTAAPVFAGFDAKPAETINGRPVKAFVSSECGGCHNPKRTGATGPNITQQRLREGIGDGEGGFKTSKITGRPLTPFNEQAIFMTVKHGRTGTSMPAWGTDSNPIGKALSDAEIRAVTDYLWNNAAPKRFYWSREKMEDSLEVLVPKSEQPAEPTHDHPVDNLLLATEREYFSVAVIDGDSFEVVAHLKAGARAHGYTFSPDGRYAYNLGRDGWLYKYDLYSLKPVRRIRLGLDARGIAISDDGRYIMTGMYIPTQAVMVDADTLEPVKVIDTHGVAAITGGKVDSRICSVNDVKPSVGPYFLLALKEAGQIWRVNYDKPGFPVKKVGNVGKILHDGFLRPDNKVFFLASQNSNHVAALDVESMEILAKIETGTKPHPGPGAVWREDGVEYAATPHIGEGKNVIWNDHTFEVVGEVPSGGPGLFVRAREDMKYVWFDSVFPPASNEITVHERKPPFKVVKRINEGTMTLHPEPDADGSHVFVSDWKEGVIRVYDDETLEKVATITDVRTPTGIFSVSRAHHHEGH
ncbi:nitrite reductase [Arhodomonas aquaeolei]|uniref:nitrite reductase n=1 Tax=Arhodomonas aquaeolei TaxID=2369 RepID=UPI000A04A0EF|nr:nitrite reductase [Arhodomonas aquaeolei]